VQSKNGSEKKEHMNNKKIATQSGMRISGLLPELSRNFIPRSIPLVQWRRAGLYAASTSAAKRDQILRKRLC